MKIRNLIIGAVVAAVVVLVGFMMVAKSPSTKKAPARPVAPSVKVAVKGAPGATPKKPVITKDMGGLTVKLVSSKGKDVSAKIRAFRTINDKSSVHIASFGTNRMQELVPGAYDVEVETTPVMIFKGINVQKNREAVEDLGLVTGSLDVKAVGGNKKPAAYPVRVLYAKTNVPAVSSTTNKPVEIVAGAYDVEIGSVPRQVRKDVRIDAGKETVIDIGPAGSMSVNVSNDAGKKMRHAVKVKKAEGTEVVATGTSNRAMDIMPGIYIVEVASAPAETRGDVKILAGEETVIDIVVPAPVPPAPKPAAPVPAQVKK